MARPTSNGGTEHHEQISQGVSWNRHGGSGGGPRAKGFRGRNERDLRGYHPAARFCGGIRGRAPAASRCRDPLTAGRLRMWKSPPKRSSLGGGKTLALSVASPRSPLERLHLRWLGRLPEGSRFLGDHWERSYGDLEWRGFDADRVMPWYFLAATGQGTHGYGVKTGGERFLLLAGGCGRYFLVARCSQRWQRRAVGRTAPGGGGGGGAAGASGRFPLPCRLRTVPRSRRASAFAGKAGLWFQ